MRSKSCGDATPTKLHKHCPRTHPRGQKHNPATASPSFCPLGFSLGFSLGFWGFGAWFRVPRLGLECQALIWSARAWFRGPRLNLECQGLIQRVGWLACGSFAQLFPEKCLRRARYVKFARALRQTRVRNFTSGASARRLTKKSSSQNREYFENLNHQLLGNLTKWPGAWNLAMWPVVWKQRFHD